MDIIFNNKLDLHALAANLVVLSYPYIEAFSGSAVNHIRHSLLIIKVKVTMDKYMYRNIFQTCIDKCIHVYMYQTIEYILMKLGTHVAHDKEKNCVDFPS